MHLDIAKKKCKQFKNYAFFKFLKAQFAHKLLDLTSYLVIASTNGLYLINYETYPFILGIVITDGSLLLGFIQLVRLAKYSELFPTMTELFKPRISKSQNKHIPKEHKKRCRIKKVGRCLHKYGRFQCVFPHDFTVHKVVYNLTYKFSQG